MIQVLFYYNCMHIY